MVGWVLMLMKASAPVPEGAPEGLQFPAVSQAPLVAPVQVEVCPHPVSGMSEAASTPTTPKTRSEKPPKSRKVEVRVISRVIFIIENQGLPNTKYRLRPCATGYYRLVFQKYK
jgi:hypothetical protein